METEQSLDKFILANANLDMFLTANMDMEPPVLYLSSKQKDAFIWNIKDEKICNEQCNMFWDIWDEDEPRPTLYKKTNSFNQLWNIYVKGSQIIFYSKNDNVRQRGLSYRGDSVFFVKEPRPFIVVKTETKSSTTKIQAKSQKHDLTFAIDNAWKLRSTYEEGYAFPDWSIKMFEEHYDQLAPKCRVYYSNGNLEDAKLLALKREPVNIAMNRYYDKGKLKKYFGWSKGYYGEYYETKGKLAPNLAIYCPTYVTVRGNYKKVHILNSIGYAFDSKKQPDYMVLSAQPPSILYDRYELVFEKIYQCAKDIGATTVVMSYVGAGVFSKYWPDLMEIIWTPAFERVSSDYKDVTAYFMAPPDVKTPRKNIGLFPDNVERVHNLDDTLFVNAWDPWSIAGNGNDMDNSLDGYVGRNSMVALLTWPLTNLELADKFKQITI